MLGAENGWVTPDEPEYPLSARTAPTLAALDAHLVECRACPRLVAWREHVAAVKRASFREEDYWARPVPGFGDERAGILVVGGHGRRLVGQARAVHGREQEVAAAVAREHASRAVGPVRGGREPDDEDPRALVAEAGHRAGPVVVLAERRALDLGDVLAPRDQPRARAARDDVRVEGRECG